MDLVSCRNLLIYLDTMQRQVLGVLHFALEPRGYLLLGRSESAASCPDLFEPVDKEARLFRAREAVAGRELHWSGRARDARRRARAPLPLDSGPDASVYEELVAANEELQSLNEELESSKEEIESVSEELRTLNQELRSRNAALHVAHEFLRTTLDTMRSALVVLDRDHRVVDANRSFYDAFHLTAAEVERRRISEVAPEYFASPGFTQVLEQVRAGVLPSDDTEIEFSLPGGGVVCCR